MIFFDVIIVFVFLISRWYVVIEITGMYFCDLTYYDVIRHDYCHHWMEVTQKRQLFN